MDRAQIRLVTITDAACQTITIPGLRVRAKPPEGPTVEMGLGMSSITVGTSPDCNLVISDPRVSRRHCSIRLTQQGVLICDLGSKNGVFAGGVRILEGFVPQSLPLTIGGSTLVVEELDPPITLPLSSSARFGDAVGESVSMRMLFALLERAAATNETILLLGESGTGKELLARAIHAHSPRSTGPFVLVDCSAIAANLMDDELFGHARGAFTGAQTMREGLLEQANGGTVFIDELGELSPELQLKLLRAIESREIRKLGSNKWQPIDIRIVAATHRKLRELVQRGEFREDLYYRLAVVEAFVPPLRERMEDLPLLVNRLLATLSPPRTLQDLPPGAISMLLTHDWPGNVRELRNTLARLAIMPELGKRAISSPPAPSSDDENLDSIGVLGLREARTKALEQFERRYIQWKLRESDGNRTKTASAMGISRQLLHRLLVRYGFHDRM